MRSAYSALSPEDIDRRRFLKLGGLGLVGVALPYAFPREALAGTVSPDSRLEAQVGAAARKYGVPEELLLAIGYVNSRWQTPPPSPYEKGNPEARGTFGVMELTRNPSQNTLGEAAKLTGIPARKLKTDRASNILGAAAVLAKMAGERKPSGINGWYAAVRKYGAGDLYAEQVFEALRSGASAKVSGQNVRLAPQSQVSPRTTYSPQSSSADYSRAAWYGTNGNNYTPANRPHDLKINKIVIHVTQSSWGSAINWFQNPNAQASAHYVVRSKDGFIGQSVREHNIAWHAGNWNYNQHSVGIEHEGYINDSSWFTDAMYRSSARLSAYLCNKYHIPIDRNHIIGHNEVPDPNHPGEYGGVDHHKDPGPYWNWSKYISYIREYAGSTRRKPSYVQIVDNTSSRFQASKHWGHSHWNDQRYGPGYRFADPKSVDDPARYRIKIPHTGNYRVYAHWPANAGYNYSTPIGVRTTSGLKWIRVNQRKNGGRWNYIGTFHLAAGDRDYVLISRWTRTGGYVIADAVKVEH